MAFVILCCSANAADPDYTKVPAPPQPYTVEGLRAWHKAMNPWPWPYGQEEELHLRSPKKGELLLCFVGGARGGQYALFAKAGNSWTEIGQVDQAHHPIRVLKHQEKGWHDFETFVPLWGSGGFEVLVPRYRWTGSEYRELSRSEGKFCDYEPFKSSPEYREICR